MDCRVWQKAYRLYFLWPWRRASSSDDGPANEPSAEILGCRGGARSQEVRQGIFTTDEGSPHLEWHRRFGDGPDALGAREDRVYVEISTYRQKVRPNRNFSRLRYLTLLADHRNFLLYRLRPRSPRALPPDGSKAQRPARALP